MSAGKYTFLAEQGGTFNLLATWKDEDGPINLNGYTAKMQARDKTNTLVIELNTSNGRIALGGAAGTIQFTISATDTSNLPVGMYEYDLFMTVGSTVTKLLEGDFVVVKKVTS